MSRRYLSLQVGGPATIRGCIHATSVLDVAATRAASTMQAPKHAWTLRPFTHGGPCSEEYDCHKRQDVSQSGCETASGTRGYHMESLFVHPARSSWTQLYVASLHDVAIYVRLNAFRIATVAECTVSECICMEGLIQICPGQLPAGIAETAGSCSRRCSFK